MSPFDRYQQNYRRHLWDTYGPNFRIPKRGDLIEFRTKFWSNESAFDQAIVTDVKLPTVYFAFPDRPTCSTGVASVIVVSRPPPGSEVNYR